MELKYILAIVIIAASVAGGWSLGADRVQRKWDKERLAIADESREAAERSQKHINELEKTKYENDATISKLRDDVAGFRVRVPKAPCTRPEPAGGSEGAVAGTGQPVDKSQEAFDDFRRGLESDAENADKIIENCRVVADWAKGLKSK